MDRTGYTGQPLERVEDAALLRGEGIESFVLDMHASVIDGSIGVLPRRIMVGSGDLPRARLILDDAGVEYDRSTKPI